MAEPTQTRRLAAILAGDVVGYSRMMGEDEAGALAAVQSSLDEVVKPALDAHNGRLVKLMGDGALAEFGSVVDAVKCAVAIQSAMAARNEAAAPRVEFRIGVNLGDIIFDGDDIFGDGVNIAARLEGIAEPGGICVSGAVAGQVGAKAGVAFHPLGPQTLKNIAIPVEVFRVVPEGAAAPKPHRNRTPARMALLVLAAIGVALAWWMTRPDFTPADPAKMAAPLPDGPSIAVLPFDYLGPDRAANEYLADGLSENIISALAHLPNATVIARNSTFTYKGKPVDVREVSERFGVRHVLEGSVQLSGETIRVTAQLVDGVDGRHLWTETYDRPVGDLFAVQDEITLALVRSIYGETIAGSEVSLMGRGAPSLEVMSLMLRAFKLLDENTPDSIEASKIPLNRVIELVPDYTGGYGGLAFTHFFEARYALVPDPAAALEKAAALAEKSLSLKPDNASAHCALAYTRMIQRRPEEAIAAARRAVEFEPGNAFAQASLGWVLQYSGAHREALTHIERALRIYVIAPWWLHAVHFNALFDLGEPGAAVAPALAGLAQAPPPTKGDMLLSVAAARFAAGERDEGRRLMNEALALNPGLSVARARWWDIPYFDQTIPERRYEVMREMGLPETPPSGG